MKKLFSLIFTVIVGSVYGQNYELFNESSGKLFTDSNNTYSIKFDSVQQQGNAMIFYNFSALEDTRTTSNCPWWGDNFCHQQNQPVWLGKKVTKHIDLMYDFLTNAGDQLSFDFTKPQGDTLIFFQNSSEKFFVIFEKTDYSTVLNYSDSVRHYKILHTDIVGNQISSNLNGKEIRVGQQLGLIFFFSG